MRILLSNDDGIHAQGLKSLYRIARKLSDDVWVVAPETEQSGAAHSLSIHTPLRIRQVGKQRYSVNGTPTDCVLVGISKLFKDKKPDLLLSGVNYGANLGEDITYSGTVAATMEATLLGIPAIALSQTQKGNVAPKWSTAEYHAPTLIEKLIHVGWPKDVFININFPDTRVKSVRGVQIVKHGQRNIVDGLKEWKDPRDRSFFWIGALRDERPTEAHTDLSANQDNAISVTPLHLDLTHYKTLTKLKEAFDEDSI